MSLLHIILIWITHYYFKPLPTHSLFQLPVRYLKANKHTLCFKIFQEFSTAHQNTNTTKPVWSSLSTAFHLNPTFFDSPPYQSSTFLVSQKLSCLRAFARWFFNLKHFSTSCLSNCDSYFKFPFKYHFLGEPSTRQTKLVFAFSNMASLSSPHITCYWVDNYVCMYSCKCVWICIYIVNTWLLHQVVCRLNKDTNHVCFGHHSTDNTLHSIQDNGY